MPSGFGQLYTPSEEILVAQARQQMLEERGDMFKKNQDSESSDEDSSESSDVLVSLGSLATMKFCCKAKHLKTKDEPINKKNKKRKVECKTRLKFGF